MSWPITQLTVDEFEVLLRSLDFSRSITSVHLHHTWRPNHAQWRGRATVEAMRRVHMQERGFSDIAQHLSIDPYGGLWTGRDFNRPPASARGLDPHGRPWNGDGRSGPFMIELVGDFDDRRDVLAGAQKQALIEVVGLLIWRFRLAPAAESVLGHVQMSGKTCPGSSLTAAGDAGQRLNLELTRAFDAQALALPEPAQWPSSEPVPPGLRTLVSGSLALPQWNHHDPAAAVEAAGAPEDHGVQMQVLEQARTLALGGIPAGAGRGAIDRKYAGLYGHVLNTSRGLLLESAAQAGKAGKFFTSQDELGGDLFQALLEFEQALPAGEPLRLMFHAHGGLVAEGTALQYAADHLDWWKGLRVFPFFLIWESGLLETLFQSRRQLQTTARGPLDWLFDRTDELLELAAGPAGRRIWSRMKANAELCSAADWHQTYARLGGDQPPAWVPEGVAGGARCFVRALLGVLAGLPRARKVELHAVGHSAGAIYHAHFLPMLLQELALREAQLRKLGIASLQLLAPALRLDDFEELLAPALTAQIRQLQIYTMDDRRERDDNASIYRKSLLYLVNGAFETDSEPGLLGLQRWLQARIGAGGNATAQLFANPAVEVHYSDGRSSPRTRASSHGDFDNDPTTMTSVAEVIGVPPTATTRYGSWIRKRPKRKPFKRDLDLDLDIDAASLRNPAAEGERPALGARRGAGLRALCIGIDAYPPGATLAGCVNDARSWGTALQSLGFAVEYLFDAAASGAGVRQRLQALLDESAAGDWLALQFAGHGTQLEDVDGDEASGLDQAFVPHDYQDNGCLLDDELYALLVPAARRGVQLRLFFDTCHSGSASRFAPLEAAPRGGRRRVRYLPATAQMHTLQRLRAAAQPQQARQALRDAQDGRVQWLHLAACRDEEFAYETDGAGDFSRAAVPLLAQAQQHGWTGAELLREVRKAFAVGARQTPQLMAAVDAAQPLLPAQQQAVASGNAAADLVVALEAALGAARRLAGS